MHGALAFRHHPLAQAFVGGDAAGDDDLTDVVLIRRHQGFIHQHVHHSSLETGGQIFHGEAAPLLLQGFSHPQDGSLDAAEGEIPGVFEHRPREVEGGRAAGVAGLLDRRSAGVGKAQEPGHFIEGFACGIVQRAAQALVLQVVLHQDQFAMPAGDQQGQQGEAGRLVRRGVGQVEPGGVDMPFEVVDADDRLVSGQSQALGHVHADHQRPGQAGAAGGRDGINILDIQMGLLEGLIHNGINRFDVFAGGQLGEDAAILGMQVNLAGDHVGVDHPVGKSVRIAFACFIEVLCAFMSVHTKRLD